MHQTTFTVPTDPDALAKGAEAFNLMAAQHLAASPLGVMAEWVKAGQAPPAVTLRQAGLIAEGAKQDTWVTRKAFIARWGFSIPCAEVLGVLYRLGPLVEIGAGSGYWTAIMRASGADMIATDKLKKGTPGYSLTIGLHSKIEALDGRSAILAHSDRNVFCSWPTQGDEWCSEALTAIQPGRYFVLIGEPRGGVTGTDALFDVLDSEFEAKGRLEIPQFPGAFDSLTLHQRKG